MNRALLIAVAVVIAAGLGIGFSPADAQKPELERPKEPTPADFMRVKLSASNEILEGLVTVNFVLVSEP